MSLGSAALGIVGGAVGSLFGAPWLGYAVGSMVGGALFPTELDPLRREGPRLSDRNVNSSSFGRSITILLGQARVAGELIWSTEIRERSVTTTTEIGGKGSSQEVTTTTYTYDVSCAIAICEGEILGVRRIWANGVLIYDIGTSTDYATYLQSQAGANAIRFYSGSETQTADPLIEAEEGTAPAYRGVAYVVVDTLQLAQFGNRVPNFEFEIIQSGTLGPAYANLDTANQITDAKAVSGSIAADGTLIAGVVSTLTPSETGYLAVLNPFTAQIVRQWNVDGYLSGGYSIGRNSFPAMNIYGDIVFRDSAQQIYAWPSGGIPTKLGGTAAGNGQTRILADETGTFWYAGRWTTTAYGLVRVVPGASSGTLMVDLQTAYGAADFPDIFDSQDGYIWVSTIAHGFFKIQKSTGAVAQRIAKNALTFTIAGDGSIFYQVYTTNNVWKRLANDYVTETTIYDELGSHSTQSFIRFDRDWTTGDVLIADLQTFRRYSQSGTLLSTANTSTGGTFQYQVATNPLFPDRVYTFNSAQAGTGPNQWVAVDRSLSLAVGSVQLSDLISRVCARVGLSASDIDVTAMTDVVRGYVIQERGTARKALDPIMASFFCDAVESAGKLKFVKKGTTPVRTLTTDDIALVNPEDERSDALLTTRSQETELPREIAINYFDSDADYQVGTQYARRLVVGSYDDTIISVPIAMSATQAARMAEALLYEAWHGKQRYQFAITTKHVRLEPTDPIYLQLSDGVFGMRINRTRFSGNLIELEAIGYESDVFTPSAIGVALPFEPQAIAAPAPPTMVLIDGPILRDADDQYGFYVTGATYGNEWAGGKLFRSSDGVVYTDTGVAVSGPTALGYCITTLRDFAGGNNWDGLAILRVSLQSGSLSSLTETAVLAGGNLALVGDEVIQFKTATLVSSGVYDIKALLRGRLGTEWAIPLHASGERFTLLTSSRVSTVDVLSADNGMSFDYKLPSFGGILETAQAQTLTIRSNRLKPLQPAQLSAYRNASLDLIISWKRRARIGGGWIDGIEVPLDEPTEGYEVDVFAGTGVTLTGITRDIDATFTTSGVHSVVVNDYVYISGVVGMTQVNNRVFQVTAIPTTSTFKVGLNTSGYTAYSSGGTMRERARVYTPSTQTATYTAANQTTDYGSTQSTIYVGVCQTSSRVGRGYIATGVF